jgi:hypothetical protein
MVSLRSDLKNMRFRVRFQLWPWQLQQGEWRPGYYKSVPRLNLSSEFKVVFNILTPICRAKISGRKSATDWNRFFREYSLMPLLISLLKWCSSIKGTAAEKRTPAPAADRVPARSNCRRRHFYTDCAVLKLQLKILIMWIYFWNKRTITPI